MCSPMPNNKALEDQSVCLLVCLLVVLTRFVGEKSGLVIRDSASDESPLYVHIAAVSRASLLSRRYLPNTGFSGFASLPFPVLVFNYLSLRQSYDAPPSLKSCHTNTSGKDRQGKREAEEKRGFSFLFGASANASALCVCVCVCSQQAVGMLE